MEILDNAYYNQKLFMMTAEVSITAGYMWLGKVNLEECWSAVSPAILGVARFL